MHGGINRAGAGRKDFPASSMARVGFPETIEETMVCILLI